MLLSRQQAIPLNDYPTGKRQLPELALPDTANAFVFEIARCTSATPDIWPNAATEIDLQLLISRDGAPYEFLSGWHGVGGIVSPHGVESSKNRLTARFTPGPNLRISGTIEIFNGPLRTEGFFEVVVL